MNQMPRKRYVLDEEGDMHEEAVEPTPEDQDIRDEADRLRREIANGQYPGGQYL